jgi:hypothetical protein
MADISDVNQGDIKGLYESLESLSGKFSSQPTFYDLANLVAPAKIMTRVLY